MSIPKFDYRESKIIVFHSVESILNKKLFVKKKIAGDWKFQGNTDRQIVKQ